MKDTKKILKFKGEIKTIDVDQLIPYERNNKIHGGKQIDLLANIIGKFGYIDEIVVDKNNILIAGHGRLESIKKMGYEAVECKVLDIDSKNAGELRLLHNKIYEYDNEIDLENAKIEVESLGYESTMDGLNISLKELYPEFSTDEFNPEDQKEEEGKVKQVAVIVMCVDMGEAELVKTDLEGLGRKPIVKG